MTVESSNDNGANWPHFFFRRAQAVVGQWLGMVVFCLVLSVPAHDAVADPMPRFELTPFVGYRVGGSFEDADTGESVDVNEDVSYGLIFNIVEKANTQYEFGWSHQDTSVDLAGTGGNPARLDLDIDYFQIGGTYLWEGTLARPYVVATLGAAHYRSHSEVSESETYVAFSVGGGWKLWPTRRFGLRLEGRFYGTFLDSDSKIFCSSAPDNSGCLIHTRSELLQQWELMAGGVFRF